MKTKKLIAAAATAALLATVSACSTVDENSLDKSKFVVEPNEEILQVACAETVANLPFAMTPGHLYICPKFSKMFALKKIETEINEAGYLSARVAGVTSEPGFIQFFAAQPTAVTVAFRFVWFDAQGKIIHLSRNGAIGIRKIMPGDYVRFSDVAPTEETKNFSMILGVVAEKDLPMVLNSFPVCAPPKAVPAK